MQATVEARRLTVSALAAHKRLPEDWLRRCGLRDLEGGGVAVPYWGQPGDSGAPPPLVATKRRLGLSAATYRWPQGLPLAAYGLWRLRPFHQGGDLILVEGESDCWALWHAGLPALGLPGANSCRQTLHRHALDGVETVFVHREPGRGGDAFLEGCLQALRVASYAGQARLLTMPEGVKDPCELHGLNLTGCSFFLALRERLWEAPEIPGDLWLGPHQVRRLVAEALRDPSPWLRRLLLEALAEDLGKLVGELLRRRAGAVTHG